MDNFFVASRERLRADIQVRWKRELQLCYRSMGTLMAALQRERPVLDGKRRRVAYFLALKAMRSFQSILACFENGLVQDSLGLLRPMVETCVDAAYIFGDEASTEGRVEAFLSHMSRSLSRLERTRERVLPEMGGSRGEYLKQLEEGLARLPFGSEKQGGWTALGLEDRIREIDKRLKNDGGKAVFRFLIAVYADACQILHSDIAGVRFYMKPGADGELRFMSTGPDVPEDAVPPIMGLMCLLVTLSAIVDVLAPGIKRDVEELSAETMEVYRVGKI